MSPRGRGGSGRRRRRTPLGFRVLASALLLVVVFLLGEGFARVLSPEVPTWRGGDTGSVIMVGHPTRLWGMGTGTRQNSGTTAFINDLGLRGEIPTTPRPPGVDRIMVLGDSTYFGHGVSDSQTFPAQLQALLQAQGLSVEVVNGGIPGYSTEQSRLLLDEVGWSLEPTLLLVGNLWSDNNFDHFADADLLRTRRVVTASWLLTQSQLFQLLAGTIDRLRGGEGARIVTWTRDSEWPTVGVRRVPLRRYAENLDGMVHDARSRGIGVAFFTPCNREMARGDSEDDVVWGAYFDAQAAVASFHGLPRTECRGPMKAAAKAQGVEALFVDEMHPSAAGHAVFAQAAAQSLLGAGWPNQKLLGKEGYFPLDGVFDRSPTSADGLNPRSPQVNLFANGEPPPATSVSADGGDGERFWTLTGEVKGGSGSVRVEVRALTGEQVSVATLPAAGPFRLNVRNAHPEVTVVAVDAAGGRVEAAARREDDGPVVLAIP
mgnify:CR=1 FL=1